MDFYFQIKMNERLFHKDPEDTELGRKIIQSSITMIHDTGFESFTFKKLAETIGTTEASIYRYFENKHKLLLYIVSWYWSWLEYLILFHIQNLVKPEQKIKKVIQVLTSDEDNTLLFKHIDKRSLHQIVVAEGSKAYLTKQVTKDNQDKLFKPYKDLCARIAAIILEYRPDYPYSRSLASTMLEMSHLHVFFMEHLPSLTDFASTKDRKELREFFENMVFSSLRYKPINN